MMRLKLFQLIQYVRDGEVDPKLKAALQADPDSDRRLRQARFICKMIGRQKKPDQGPDAIGEAFSFESTADSYDRAELRPRMMRSARFEEDLSELRALYIPEDEEYVPQISNLVMDRGLPGRDLGQVTVSEHDGFIELALESDHQSTEVVPGEIRIDDDRYSLSMPSRFPAAVPLRLRLTYPPRGSALRGLGVLFMPESGPFIRRGTDADGVFELPLAATPGILRISVNNFAFLRIARDK